MAGTVSSKTVQVPAMIRESDGALLIWTSRGYVTPEDAGVVIDESSGGGGSVPVDDSGNVPTSMETLLAGENQDRDAIQTIPGATERWPVEAGQVDVLLGMVGSAGDYLDCIDVVVTDSTKSQIILRDGMVAPVLSLTTHDATASTATVINTAVNAAAVAADQFRGCLMKIGGEYSRMKSHGPFAAGVVNQFTLDRALAAAPGLSAAFTIEDRRYAFEIAPTGTLHSGQRVPVTYSSKQAGLRISPGAGVRLAAIGDFT